MEDLLEDRPEGLIKGRYYGRLQKIIESCYVEKIEWLCFNLSTYIFRIKRWAIVNNLGLSNLKKVESYENSLKGISTLSDHKISIFIL